MTDWKYFGASAGFRASSDRRQRRVRTGPYMDDEVINEPWYRLVIIYGGRYAAQVRAKALAIAAALVAAFFIYWLIAWASGNTNVDETIVKASFHYNEDMTDPKKYKWWRNAEPDESIAAHVLEARASMNRSDLLALVPRDFDADTTPTAPIRCKEMFSPETDLYYQSMMADADRFLTANPNYDNCTCAPLIGRQVRYLAVVMSRAGDGRAIVSHFFNPEDETRDAYDRLDADSLDADGVSLLVTNETLDERYNEPRGRYQLVRRGSFWVTLYDYKCKRERVRFSNQFGVCVQRCLDLLDGIDVRARARGQHALGIKLNCEAFDKEAEEDAQRVARSMMPVPTKINYQDEL